MFNFSSAYEITFGTPPWHNLSNKQIVSMYRPDMAQYVFVDYMLRKPRNEYCWTDLGSIVNFTLGNTNIENVVRYISQGREYSEEETIFQLLATGFSDDFISLFEKNGKKILETISVFTTRDVNCSYMCIQTEDDFWKCVKSIEKIQFRKKELTKTHKSGNIEKI